MKSISIAVLLLLAACAHKPLYSTPHMDASPTEADANAIAQAAVLAKEKWKRVDSVARPVEGGWSVVVRPISARVAGPYVLVTVDIAGQISYYERARFSK